MYEEAFTAPGQPREHYAQLLDGLQATDLDALSDRVAGHLDDAGVRFGTGADAGPFTVDPLPRVLTSAEWDELSHGLTQRVRALNAFLNDIYGEQRIVRAGVIPQSVIESAPHYEPALVGAGPIDPIRVAGLDVVRDTDGRFLVLEDNVRSPSGLAYAVAARDALDACLPDVPAERVELDAAFGLLGDALRGTSGADVTGDPHVVLLTDGPDASAYYEHRVIARALGIPLVRPSELVRRGDELHALTDAGVRRVDVVYRRTADERLTDDDGRLTSVASTLYGPWQAGRLGIANGFGTGVADDKLVHAYVEDMIRFYCDEEPLVGSVVTYDLGEPARAADVIERVAELVVKPRGGSGGEGVLIGPRASHAERQTAACAIAADPRGFVAQETIMLSRHPTVVNGRLEPRHIDLRAFVFCGGRDRAVALPGGLTRVALRENELVVNSHQQGGAKDTWVLGDE